MTAVAAPRRRSPVPLEQLDRRVEREREEERHQDPRQDLARDPDDRQQSRDRQDDPDDGQDRARTEGHDPLFWHGGRIAAGSDGRAPGMIKCRR